MGAKDFPDQMGFETASGAPQEHGKSAKRRGFERASVYQTKTPRFRGAFCFRRHNSRPYARASSSFVATLMMRNSSACSAVSERKISFP